MRKYLVLIICLFAFLPSVNALESPETFIRTKENLRVNKNYKITENNINNVMNTPSVDSNLKIYDFANLLEDDYFEAINNYIKSYNMDMVVVTIDKNNVGTAKIFGQDFYDYNDFGMEFKHYSGILLIIDLDTLANNGDRRVEIVTTGQAILVYDDSRINNILDNMMDGLYSGDYDYAVKKFISSSKEYASLGIASSNSNLYIDEDGNIIKRFVPNFFCYFIIAIGTTIITLWILISKNKMIKNIHGAKEYLTKNEIDIQRKDMFITTNTVRTKIITDTSSGGSGGGSSFSGGSSGSSHGGGGRSF